MTKISLSPQILLYITIIHRGLPESETVFLLLLLVRSYRTRKRPFYRVSKNYKIESGFLFLRVSRKQILLRPNVHICAHGVLIHMRQTKRAEQLKPVVYICAQFKEYVKFFFFFFANPDNCGTLF